MLNTIRMSASDKLAELLGLTAEEVDESIRIGESVMAEGAASSKTVKPSPDAAAVLSNEASILVAESSGKVGLYNCGNSCYMNAVLQMLYHIPEFKSAVIDLGVGGALPPSEPFLTLYNIFSAIDTTALAGETKFNPGELLNLDFECLYEVLPGTIYRANESNPIPVNRLIREEGIKKKYFTEEDIKDYKEGNLGSFEKREALLKKLLARNQAAVKADTPAERRRLVKYLTDTKEAARKNLDTLARKFSIRVQDDASEFLQRCIFQKIDNAGASDLLRFYKYNLQSKLTGEYDSAEFPAEMRGARVGEALKFKDEDGKTDTTLYHKGEENGVIQKIKIVPAASDFIFFIPILKGITSIQDLINIPTRETLPLVYTDRRGALARETISLNIPKNITKPLDREKRFNKTHRIIPLNVEKDSRTQIPLEQKYFIVSLKRYTNDRKKIQTKIKMNKELSVTSDRIEADGTITSSIVNFELEGVICHSGPSMKGGHYYYYWKDPTGIWFNFNDSNVRELDVIPDAKYLRISNIEEQGVILLYKRIERDLTPIPMGYRNYDREAVVVDEELNFKTDDELKNEYGFSNSQIKEIRNKASVISSGKESSSWENMNAAIAESLRIEEEKRTKPTTIPSVKELEDQLAQLEYERNNSRQTIASIKPTPIPSVKELQDQLSHLDGKKSEVFMNDPLAGDMGMKASIEELVDDTIKRYKNSDKKEEQEAKEYILKFDDDILFEIAKKLSPTLSHQKLGSLRSSIIQKLRTSDKEKGTTYIYELTQTWKSKAYFLPASKFMLKPLLNYNEDAYQANKTRYEKRKTKGGRQSLRRKTRKLKHSKV